MRKFVCLVTALALAVTVTVTPARSQATEVKDQLIADLVAAGVSTAAALVGSVPLALLAGFLTKYITTYGIAGVRALIDAVKGYKPKELGEINVLHIYLLHIKQNLYKTLIDIREAAAVSKEDQELATELERITKVVSDRCAAEPGGCKPMAIDPTMISYDFLNIALDGKRTIDINNYLSIAEIKNTYQYLMLLYLDVIITEQRLIEYQYDVLSERVSSSLEMLDKNVYLSQPEKEYQTQMILNLALSWQKMADERRVIIATALKNPLEAIKQENDGLEDDIEKYRCEKRGKCKKGGGLR